MIKQQAHEIEEVSQIQPAESRASVVSFRLLHWIVLGLCVVAAFALWPLWAPLVVAAWVAMLSTPLLHRLTRREAKKRQAAGLITTAIVVSVLVPLALIAVSLSGAAIQLARAVLSSQDRGAALRGLLSDGSRPKLDFQQATNLLREYGQTTFETLTAVAGATTNALIGLIVFVAGTYSFLVHGHKSYMWFAERAVIPRSAFHRFANAFNETGRGLLIGTGLTALIQGVAAGIGYVILGIPRAIVLGFVTAVAALIPSVGTALVWVPVAIGLFATGNPGKGVAMLAIGSAVALFDNLLRPVLSRYGSLKLPTFLLFIAMLGGIPAFGAWGLLLGPLIVRLAKEGLDILRPLHKEEDAMPSAES